jgi:hypothetical protein
MCTLVHSFFKNHSIQTHLIRVSQELYQPPLLLAHPPSYVTLRSFGRGRPLILSSRVIACCSDDRTDQVKVEFTEAGKKKFTALSPRGFESFILCFEQNPTHSTGAETRALIPQRQCRSPEALPPAPSLSASSCSPPRPWRAMPPRPRTTSPPSSQRAAASPSSAAR